MVKRAEQKVSKKWGSEIGKGRKNKGDNIILLEKDRGK